MLHEFLTKNTPEIIALSRAKVAMRTSPLPTEAELKNGVPLFLSQLIGQLQLATTDSAGIKKSASLHGGEMLEMGFNVSQVVHGYGDVCQAITELADKTNAPITVDEFKTLNMCLDDAIANSVTEFERRRDESVAYEGMERLGVLSHELRNRVSAAMLAFHILEKGTVAIGGSTGAVLGRSLRALHTLVNNSLAGVRLEAGLGEHKRISVAELIGEAAVEVSLGAVGRLGLAVFPVATDLEVNGDPQILAAAIGNLLQNAFKFSRPAGHVSLRTTATADRVRIDVEDECGGLQPGNAEALFVPFGQQNADKTGLGLGLSISRKGVEAMGGTIAVRDLPGKGCIFTIDLPRLPAAA